MGLLGVAKAGSAASTSTCVSKVAISRSGSSAVEFSLDQVADHAFAFRHQHIERIRNAATRRGGERQRAELRTVAMRHDDFVVASNRRDSLGGSAQMRCKKRRVRRFVPPLQRVATQSHDHAHQACSKNSSIADASVGVPASAKS